MMDFSGLKPVEIPTYTAQVPVAAWVPDDWRDWSNVMQEKLLKAIDETMPPLQLGRRREIVDTRCLKDPDGWYVRIVIMDLYEVRQ